jgi:Cu-Zn family superoxide dismutase
MHLHVNGSCGPGPNPTGETIAAGAAGGHFDPARTGRHEGPHGGGHLGDLPILVVGADGKASATLTAPRLQDLEALRGRALIIHVGGDNFRDVPAPLGGGGGRLACGVLN